MRHHSVALLLTIVAACFFAACDDGTSHGTTLKSNVQASVGEPFWLQFGAAAEVRPVGLHLTFAAVLEDARCPVEYSCYTPGRFRAEFAAELPDRPPESVEASWLAAPKDLGDGLFRLQLLAVEPAGHVNQQVPLDRYYVQLVVTQP